MILLNRIQTLKMTDYANGIADPVHCANCLAVSHCAHCSLKPG